MINFNNEELFNLLKLLMKQYSEYPYDDKHFMDQMERIIQIFYELKQAQKDGD